MSGRLARCSCGRTEPSDPERAFALVPQGEGSRRAVETCGTCGYHLEAHLPPRPGVVRSAAARVCDEFVPHGPWPFDSFYCGHRGWD